MVNNSIGKKIMRKMTIYLGTNDAFVLIELGKEKFQTSVKVKTIDEVRWNEQCEM